MAEAESVYHMGGNLWIEQHGEHVYIKDNDTDDVIALYIPQGDCESMADALMEIARRYNARLQKADERDKLRRLVSGAGLPGGY